MSLHSLLSASLAIVLAIAFSGNADAQFDFCSDCDAAASCDRPLGNLFKNDCCGNWYVGGFGGWVGQTEASFDTDISGPGFDPNDDFDEEFSSDSGFGIGGVLGRRLNNGFRLEADFIFRHQDLDGAGELDFDAGDIVSADVSTFALNWNVAYDFRRGSKFNPYVGVGTGIYFVNFEADGFIDSDSAEVELSFPWANLQWFAGVSSPISERAEWFVEYRGLTTYGIDISAVDGLDQADFQASTYHSSIFSGIRFNLR